jgi:type II restriction enzyme
MIAAIRSDATPNLLVLQYSGSWTVQNLMLIPSFFFTESAIEKRLPLAPTARRAGWVGCNILLSAIAAHGKIKLVEAGVILQQEDVRQRYAAVRPTITRSY